MKSVGRLPTMAKPILRTSFALSFAGTGALLAVLANCASSESADSAKGPPPTIISTPDAEVDAGADADAGCSAGDPTCTTEELTCDQVAWCSSDTGVSRDDRFTKIWGSSATDVWAIGSRGIAVHWDGSTWKPFSLPVKATFFALWGSGPNDIWTASDTQTIFHTEGFKNGTVEWVSKPASFVDYYSKVVGAIWGSGPNDVRVGGGECSTTSWPQHTGNMLLRLPVDDGEEHDHETDAGDAGAPNLDWVPVAGYSGTVNGIWGSSATNVWALIDNRQTISNYEGMDFEAGKTIHGTPPASPDVDTLSDTLAWESVDSQSAYVLRGIWGSSESDVWAVGDHGTIRHITPSDSRWQIVESPTTVSLRAIWGTGPNDIWVVGDAGTILHYDGTAFTPSTAQLPVGKKPDLWGVWGSSTNDVWIVGDNIALHYSGPKATTPSGDQ